MTAELETIESKKAGYIVISSWESEPDWLRAYLLSNQTQFQPVYQSISSYHNQQTYAVVFSAK
jgi:hypothetical protein